MKKTNNAHFVFTTELLPRPEAFHMGAWKAAVAANRSDIAFQPVNCRFRFGKDYEVRICLGGVYYLLCIVPLEEGLQAARIADHARYFFRGYSNRTPKYNFPIIQTEQESRQQEFAKLHNHFRNMEVELLDAGKLVRPERKNNYRARFEQMEDVVDKMLTRIEALERKVG